VVIGIQGNDESAASLSHGLHTMESEVQQRMPRQPGQRGCFQKPAVVNVVCRSWRFDGIDITGNLDPTIATEHRCKEGFKGERVQAETKGVVPEFLAAGWLPECIASARTICNVVWRVCERLYLVEGVDIAPCE